MTWLWIAVAGCLSAIGVCGALIGWLFRIIDRDRKAWEAADAKLRRYLCDPWANQKQVCKKQNKRIEALEAAVSNTSTCDLTPEGEKAIEEEE